MFTCGFLKNDCVRRGLMEQVFEMFARAKLNVMAFDKTTLSVEQAKLLRWAYRKQAAFQEMYQAIAQVEIIPFVVGAGEGVDPFDALNVLVGGCVPALAPIGTIRHELGVNIKDNIIHSTDDIETMERELDILNPAMAKAFKNR
jgi:nucleoside-diphosphate kinase